MRTPGAFAITFGSLVILEHVTLVKRKSDLDKRVWMQLVDDSAMILGH
jgi:hypothetical protein